MGLKTKNPDLTKKDKLAIVRSIIIRMPNYREYGFNRNVIKVFKKEHGITLTDRDISGYIKEIEEAWIEVENITTSKSQLKEMLFNIYAHNRKNPNAQIRSLREIGKLDGHYKLDVNLNIANIPEEKAKKLEEIFGAREKKKEKKDNNNE